MSAAATILWKDLLSEWRSRATATTTVVFALLILLVFNFSLDLEGEHLSAVGPGLLWIALLLPAMFGLGRGIAEEYDRGTLEGTMLTPIDSASLFVGTVAGNLVLALAVQVPLVVVFAILFPLPVVQPAFLPVLVLGSLGLALLTTLVATMTSVARVRELLLPVLVLPLALPILIASVAATDQILRPGQTPPIPWVGVLAAFDGIFGVAALWGFDRLLED